MLTEQQIQSLTEQQQQTVAEVELCLARKRQRVLETARINPQLYLAPFVFPIVTLGILNLGAGSYIALIFAVAVTFALIQVHVISLNRRLDAIIELFGAAWQKEASQK